MRDKVGVVISVYKKDKVKYLKESIDSLFAQTHNYLHIFLYVDGYVEQELSDYIENLSVLSSVSVFWGKENSGLALRLNYLIDCILPIKKFKYVARMDADDICHPDRLKKQIDFLIANPEVDVVGSSIFEMNNAGQILSYKQMPTSDTELKKNIIKRCPFNHPTVMFRRRVFADGNRYSSYLKNTQDYYLWIELAKKGYTFANIDEPLLNFRVDDNFHVRRGKSKAKNDFNAKLYAMKQLECQSIKNWSYAFAIYALRMSPPIVSKTAYKYLRNAKKIDDVRSLQLKYAFKLPH